MCFFQFLRIFSFAIFLFLANPVKAANLIEVYQESLTSDPVFQQAIAQRLSQNENVPISLGNLLPSVGVTATPSLNKTATSGPASLGQGSYSSRDLIVNASMTQTIFNYAQFANYRGAKATAKQADATFTVAAQTLILRVAKAYFAILQDEDILQYATANRNAYAKQLEQVNLQYKVGVKTVTDLYTAQAAYDTSDANYIATATQLANDKENLRAITGRTYASLSKLRDKFPFISPEPANIDTWVKTATEHNWSIKAAQYGAEVALQNVKQQFAGNLPTLSAEGIYTINTSRNTGSSNPLFNPPGSEQIHNRTVQLNLNVPVLAGGQVVAQTKQAQYNYQSSAEQLEQAFRNTINITRQSYLNVIAGISKIKADRQAVKSALSSYEGLEAQYHVGTATLVDVVNQQQRAYLASQQYAADKYAYIINLLTLKQAAGTLNPDDLGAINAWLSPTVAISSKNQR